MRPAIRVDNLSKRYRLGHQARSSYRTVRESLMDAGAGAWRGVKQLGSRFLGKGREEAAAPDPDEFWALKDISFEVKPGEVIGIIGRNGAGKSTLLKILSRITEPTTGRAEIRGRLSSLLEVGTGFHSELTGRENIYLNGSILGMSRREITRKFDEIVAFSEIEQFLDTPVKRYSSGMYVRLAFAVAAHLQPDILIVDEVLAVGDIDFQKKCLGKMGDVAHSGTTVLFVSHNLTAVSSLCSQAILLEHGIKRSEGSAPDVIGDYIGNGRGAEEDISWAGNVGDDNARLMATRVVGDRSGSLTTDMSLRIQVIYRVLRPVDGLIVAVEIGSRTGGKLIYSVRDDREPPPGTTTAPGLYCQELVIPANTFAEGNYYVNFDFGLHAKKQISFDAGMLLFALQNVAGVGRRYPSGWTNLIRPDWRWQETESWLPAASANGVCQEIRNP